MYTKNWPWHLDLKPDVQTGREWLVQLKQHTAGRNVTRQRWQFVAVGADQNRKHKRKAYSAANFLIQSQSRLAPLCKVAAIHGLRRTTLPELVLVVRLHLHIH